MSQWHTSSCDHIKVHLSAYMLLWYTRYTLYKEKTSESSPYVVVSRLQSSRFAIPFQSVWLTVEIMETKSKHLDLSIAFLMIMWSWMMTKRRPINEHIRSAGWPFLKLNHVKRKLSSNYICLEEKLSNIRISLTLPTSWNTLTHKYFNTYIAS